jgi:hypothetical protein
MSNRPEERLDRRDFIGLGHEPVDGFLERDQGVEDAAPQAPFGELGKEPLDRIDPGCGGRREVEGPARMARGKRSPM